MRMAFPAAALGLLRAPRTGAVSSSEVRASSRAPAPSLFRRLQPLAFGLVAIVGFILVLTWVTLQAQTALAGFLNGESIWSKAEEQVTIDLLSYSATGNPADYADFQRNYAVLDAYRSARDLVLSGHFDYAEVERDMRRGGAMPVAIPKAIFLLDHFANAPYMKQALALWTSTDGDIAKLKAIGDELHRSYASGSISPAEVIRQRNRINAINKFVQPRTNRFSMALAKGTVAIGRISFVSVFVLTAAALLLWFLMARRTFARIRGSEERYRVLFDSAPDAIVLVDEANDRILDANRAAGEWTGRDTAELQGAPYAELFRKGAPEALSGGAELRCVGGRARAVETQTSMTAWGERAVRQAIIRDISERVESERDRRIAAEALASIAEGVVIADAERRVVSVNAAATRITGFPKDELMGMRLEDTRRMPDGTAVSVAAWQAAAPGSHWSGEVESRCKDGSTYAEKLSIGTIRAADGSILHYVAVFSDISVAKAAQYSLQRLAAHDSLTGLVNRSEFQRHCDAALERAARARHSAGVLFIDFDGFKFVNDSFSHVIGDDLLKLAADRILEHVGEADIVARIGGDEFTVLVPTLTEREEAASLADRLVSELSEPFHVGGYDIVLSASIGIAAYPLDGSDSASLIANADAAMYAAKTEERNTWRFYVPRMQAEAHQQMQLASELRQALLDDEFRLVYQPSVEMRSRRVVAVEALLRWQHPERGEVMPDEFIPVAERIGMIHRIDEWVMAAVCAQLHAWDEAGMAKIRVAINVSARWFGRPGLVDSVRRVLRSNQVAPDRIVLEITESAMLRLSEETESTMRELHKLGIGVAIDDFGTGYSSMSYLKLPAIAYLKIDSSFVSGLPEDANDVAITTATLAMAESLGLATIAEGIETEAQHEFLRRAGCGEGQGFLYSYPLPPEMVERMLPRDRQRVARLKLVSSNNR